MAMTGTTPVCAYCGRPVLSLASYGNSGEVYHFECTRPPETKVEARGCVCPAGAEKTCEGAMCPRKGIRI